MHILGAHMYVHAYTCMHCVISMCIHVNVLDVPKPLSPTPNPNSTPIPYPNTNLGHSRTPDGNPGYVWYLDVRTC